MIYTHTDYAWVLHIFKCLEMWFFPTNKTVTTVTTVSMFILLLLLLLTESKRQRRCGWYWKMSWIQTQMPKYKYLIMCARLLTVPWYCTLKYYETIEYEYCVNHSVPGFLISSCKNVSCHCSSTIWKGTNMHYLGTVQYTLGTNM